MNDLLPRPWDSIAYGFVCVVSLAMTVFNIVFVSAHCEWLSETTGVPGACGLAVPAWLIFAFGFLVVAAYAGWELYRLLKKRQAKEALSEEL